MRRTALLGPIFALTLALPGCTGVDDFLDHTFSLTDNPNRPIGDSLNMRRVQGMSASAAAVTPQTGNVWPRGVDRMPTLQDIESDRSSSPRPANSRLNTQRLQSRFGLSLPDWREGVDEVIDSLPIPHRP